MRNDWTSKRAGGKRYRQQTVGSEDSGFKKLLSRREFLYGAAGVAGVAAVGAGVVIARGGSSKDDDLDILKVPKSSLTTQLDMEAIETYEDKLQLLAEHELPYGTLVWANSDIVAGCLIPTETGSPLTHLGLLALGSGHLETLMESAVGSAKGFEVYDMRATATGVIWTEANVLEGTWRVYTAAISDFTMGKPVLADKGDETYDTPMLAITDSQAFWQVLPKLPNDAGLPSVLKATTPGKADTHVVFENARRMACPPYATANSVVIAPRLDMGTVYYQLTNIDAKTGEVIDTMTLPTPMKPIDVAYGKNGFMFTFDSIYQVGEGISNLGTYCPMKTVKNGAYSDVDWFGFARTPQSPPAWAGDLLIVKSTYSVCGVDLKEGTYAVIDVDDGADNYGEFLASTGSHDTFVSFTNIDHSPVNAQAVKACRVKVWEPVHPTPEPAPKESSNSDASASSDASSASSSASSASSASAPSKTPRFENVIET